MTPAAVSVSGFLWSQPAAAYGFKDTRCNLREPVLSDETRYRLMRLLEANPGMSQRDLARELGISLGKVNYCVAALIRRGWIKVTNFKNSQKKAAYLYLLTPRGIEEKASLTVRFLQAKLREYEALKIEIEQIRHESQRLARR
jgi:EPS-associated MarR family transcriptional regulator